LGINPDQIWENVSGLLLKTDLLRECLLTRGHTALT
jgi:hypothetical protein